MAIIVKHNKVSTVPDTADTSLVRPSDWNADHTLTGFGTAAELNAGVANGVATLDSSGKVPTSQIPLQGDLNYQGAWNASTNTPTLASGVGTKGYYYVVSVAGSTNLDGITDWQIGDWAIFNGTVWQKVDNTDAVTSVNGYTGTVVLTQPDIAGTVPTSRTISTGTGLTGGGDLSANRTIAFSDLNVATWASNPTSANLANAVTDETGSGSLVFGTAPSLSAPVIDGANPYIQFNNGASVALAAGRFWYNGATGSWNAGMGGGNITQQVGEELFLYGKASSAIVDSPLQIVYQTGTVGASGVITFAPTTTGITDGDKIVGVATESIALNAFGRVTTFGVIHGITTDGSAYGETWADGDVIWYNPVTGNPTKTKPSAPNLKVSVGIVINAGSGGSGSFQVEINHGSVLGGTDSNVQLTGVTNGNILTYDGADAYWKNTDLTAGTGISISKSANGVLTITNTSPSSGGTVTSVSGTAPIASTGGNTPTISISQATTSTNGYLSSTDWNTFNNKQPAGSYLTSVTADSPLSGAGTSGSHLVIAQATTSTSGYLSSTDWNTFNNKQPAGTYVTSVGATSPVTSTGGTTPTIAMPQANGSTSGYLSSTDWTTFNNKGSGTVTSVSGTAPISVATGTTTPAISISQATTSTNGYLSSTDWNTFNNKASSFTYTSTYIPYGQGTTTPNQASNFTFDGTTQNAPIQRASNGIVVNSRTVSANYTIAATDSAMSAGPITVNSGVTVTISSGSRWVVL